MSLKKGEYIVRSIDHVTAATLIKQHHYAKGVGNVRVYCHGLFKKENSFFDAHCLGAAFWLPPTKVTAQTVHENWRKVLTLSRLVVCPSVPKNGASFLLGQSIKMLKQTDWECLVTFADTARGHTGAIYRATNWEYLGLTKPTPVWVNKDGKIQGKKRGPKNLTSQEMINLGYNKLGDFAKHKFRMKIK